MAFGKKKKQPAPAAAASAGEVQVPKPPFWFWLVKYFLFASVVAISIGILAIESQWLSGFPFTYDGPDLMYQNMTVEISFCLLTNAKLMDGGASQAARCNFVIAAAAVGIGLSLLWIVIQSMRSESDVKNYRLLLLVDFLICTLSVAWWILCGVLISIWTSEANNAGLQRNNWRNGVSAMCWINMVLCCLLALTSLIFFSRRAQRAAFTKKAKAAKGAKDVEAPAVAGAGPLSSGPAAAPAAPAVNPASAGLGGPSGGGAWGGSGPAATPPANAV